MAKKNETQDIVKCRFAGDPNDEYCKGCDGIKVKGDDGKMYDAPTCGGYEATPAEPEPSEEPASDSESAAVSQATDELEAVPVQGLTTVIRAESGLTREINGTYYKFFFSEERVVPEGCDLAAEKAALWDAVNQEVDRQLDDVLHT